MGDLPSFGFLSNFMPHNTSGDVAVDDNDHDIDVTKKRKRVEEVEDDDDGDSIVDTGDILTPSMDSSVMMVPPPSPPPVQQKKKKKTAVEDDNDNDIGSDDEEEDHPGVVVVEANVTMEELEPVRDEYDDTTKHIWFLQTDVVNRVGLSMILEFLTMDKLFDMALMSAYTNHLVRLELVRRGMLDIVLRYTILWMTWLNRLPVVDRLHDPSVFNFPLFPLQFLYKHTRDGEIVDEEAQQDFRLCMDFIVRVSSETTPNGKQELLSYWAKHTIPSLVRLVDKALPQVLDMNFGIVLSEEFWSFLGDSGDFVTLGDRTYRRWALSVPNTEIDPTLGGFLSAGQSLRKLAKYYAPIKERIHKRFVCEVLRRRQSVMLNDSRIAEGYASLVVFNDAFHMESVQVNIGTEIGALITRHLQEKFGSSMNRDDNDDDGDTQQVTSMRSEEVELKNGLRSILFPLTFNNTQYVSTLKRMSGMREDKNPQILGVHMYSFQGTQHGSWEAFKTLFGDGYDNLFERDRASQDCVIDTLVISVNLTETTIDNVHYRELDGMSIRFGGARTPGEGDVVVPFYRHESHDTASMFDVLRQVGVQVRNLVIECPYFSTEGSNVISGESGFYGFMKSLRTITKLQLCSRDVYGRDEFNPLYQPQRCKLEANQNRYCRVGRAHIELGYVNPVLVKLLHDLIKDGCAIESMVLENLYESRGGDWNWEKIFSYLGDKDNDDLPIFQSLKSVIVSNCSMSFESSTFLPRALVRRHWRTLSVFVFKPNTEVRQITELTDQQDAWSLIEQPVQWTTDPDTGAPLVLFSSVFNDEWTFREPEQMFCGTAYAKLDTWVHMVQYLRQDREYYSRMCNAKLQGLVRCNRIVFELFQPSVVEWIKWFLTVTKNYWNFDNVTVHACSGLAPHDMRAVHDHADYGEFGVYATDDYQPQWIPEGERVASVFALRDIDRGLLDAHPAKSIVVQVALFDDEYIVLK